MLTLLKKEIRDFLNSLIGYLVIAVFLVITGLFVWVFPGEMNVMDSGYAQLDTLFIIAPWVFLFLGPAISMRLFAEEYRTGTIELLLTKPLTDWQIILAKYFAGVLLMLVSLLPTLVYYYSVGVLSSPVFNLDHGAIWGSYLGLLFLSTAFVAIGLFASSLSSNQIVAFVISVFFSFIVYIGFESLADLVASGTVSNIIASIGINQHYLSISRGVVDSRDVVYFISLNALFLIFTKTRLEAYKW